jgi:hypothetical protein
VWLVDTQTGGKVTIFEEANQRALLPKFTTDGAIEFLVRPEGAQTISQDTLLRYDLHGRELSREPRNGLCWNRLGGAEIDGRFYTDVLCDGASRNGDWMLYWVTTETRSPADSTPSRFAMWAANLATGERRMLQDGLGHCGGCDGRYGAYWSPSGRYVFFAELAGGRVFLSDMEAATTRFLTPTYAQPDWSPAQPHLLVYFRDGAGVIEDLETGAITRVPDLLPLAKFDPSGKYVYSRASGPTSSGQQLEVQVYSIERQRIVSTLEGSSSWRTMYGVDIPVSAAPNGFVAVLDNAPGCKSAAVYDNGVRAACLGGRGYSISPDGSKVAYTTHEVRLFDVISRTETVLATGVVSPRDPPNIVWSSDSRYILVVWPGLHFGL